MPLETGTRVGERYRIVGPLGAGGMGVVYRARDEKLGRQVALKTLPKDRVGDARARARLLREARSAAALEHPGIAQVYDVGETDDGGAFLVMELVRGHSLRELIKSDAIEREEVLEVVEQVAAALDHAHGQGVIHRDIKPDNVMVRDDGRAVLLDFGLAKDLGFAMADTIDSDTPDAELEHITKEGTLIGTLSYLAPEQARGRDVGPKSDQFALAATAYEALAGRLPWVGREPAAILAQILCDDAPPPSSIESSLPVSVDRVFGRALAKEPEDRFADSSEFAEALRHAFVDPDAEVAAPVRPAPPSEGRMARSSVPVLVTIGVVVAGALAASLLWQSPDPSPPPPELPADAVVGCPVFEARGVDEPSSWLGAMAGDLVCRQLTFHLGGEPSRAREPAELLDLPRLAVDGFPVDPYIAPDVRERSLAAAGDLEGWVDGVVTRTARGRFEIELRLYVRGDEAPQATVTGEGAALHVAALEATRALAAEDAWPAVAGISPQIAPWLGTDDVEVALLYDALGEAVLSGVGLEETCATLMEREAALGALRGEVGRVCARFRVEGADQLEVPPLDRSSLGALALTAAEHADDLEESQLRDFAEQLADARLEQTEPYPRACLARGEILLFEQLGEMDRARDLARTAAEDHPEDWFLRVHLVRALRRTPGVVGATRALAAWHPGTPEAWRTLALPKRASDREQVREWLRRAYLSGGALPLTGIQLADALLRDEGGRDEVRTIASRYATGGAGDRLAGEYLRARLEITEAQLGAALQRLSAAFLAHDRFGRLVDGDYDAMVWLVELARLLERGPEIADPLARHYVLAEPQRLDLGQPHYEVPMIRLCMVASPEVARPCLESLAALREGRAARAGRVAGAEDLLAGALRHANGDDAGAVEAWRPLVRTRASWLPPEPFEREGEDALLARLVRAQMRRPTFGGASGVHAEEAERAARAGDSERARELAQRVIDAWSVADVEVPAVARMRALIERLGAP